MEQRACDRIRPLLHLHRSGERTLEEDEMVARHVEQCSTCRAAHEELLALDRALSAERETRPELTVRPELVEETLDLIRDFRLHHPRPRTPRPGSSQVRLVFSVALLVAACLFGTQNVRDALAMANLEDRMAATRGASGDIPGDVLGSLQTVAGMPPEAAGRVLERTLRGHPSVAVSRHRTLLGQLLLRHPRLAAVQPADGLDEREVRAILSDAAKLLNDAEQLLTGRIHDQ